MQEDCKQQIIHRDKKPENILLDANFFPKITDFGLAKLCNRDKTHITMTGQIGTPRHAAPELWKPFPITHKCDVYRFGIFLFEIIGRRRHHDINLPKSQQCFPRLEWKKTEDGHVREVMVVSRIEEKDREVA